MPLPLLSRRRIVNDHEVREPTLLALALIVLGFVVLLGVGALAMVGLPIVGYIWWTFAAVAGCAVWLSLGLRRKSVGGVPALTGRQQWSRRILGVARLLFLGLLVTWLGLIGWLA